jgi:S-adenosylmethionine:tRNA ribosyltransferase-isomerase
MTPPPAAGVLSGNDATGPVATTGAGGHPSAWPDFDLPEELVATDPIEADGGRRDDVLMLVARRGTGALTSSTAARLPEFLEPGDVLVVNTSATLPAAVPTADGRLLHLSTELPGGLWVVELRERCRAGSVPSTAGAAGVSVRLPGGGRAELLAPFPADGRGTGRLWVAALSVPADVRAYLSRFGRPIRYGCVDTEWPIEAYQTVFATRPGSAEMASAGRPFTPELVTALVTAGVVVAPLVLHTGVSSPEAHEPPYPERYAVPATTADVVNAAHDRGRRVVAVGTTVARALETVADASGRVSPGSGWTEHVIDPATGVRAIDGLLTGWHAPEASHLRLLEAVARPELLERSYAAALEHRYRWHEFGDVHLIL